MVKNVVLIVKSTPYGSVRASEGLRVAMAMIAMDVLPQLLFVDDGVYCLFKNQQPETEDLPSLSDRVKTLADLVGINAMLVSMIKRNIRIEDVDANYNLKAISLDEAAELLMESDAVITF
jgi:sulfur relay (sulfurtransferase) DsrF/TusC family protein